MALRRGSGARGALTVKLGENTPLSGDASPRAARPPGASDRVMASDVAVDHGRPTLEGDGPQLAARRPPVRAT
jgi:hypothetical protein